MEGIPFPFRSTYVLWLLIAITILEAVCLFETNRIRSNAAPLVLALLLAVWMGSLVRAHNEMMSA